ncbi:MAG: tetratricopeptide repeat protein [Verrucomicrobia bacterium]|nr:tetratricopeptide repeat protein [Verrucomicrobiota bacterium]
MSNLARTYPSSAFKHGWRLLLLLSALVMVSALACANPIVPRDDKEVLEVLPSKAAAADARALRRRQKELASDPENLEMSLGLAKEYIETSRAESDPRYLGYAEATLAPWWHLPQPPIEVLVLRATVRQSSHDFESALADLAQVLKLDPNNAQAWVTRATILQVRGEYAEAKKACVPLLRLAPELIAVTCVSSIASLTGEAAKSYELLERTLQRNTNAPVTEKLWALTVLAETAERMGRASDADQFFKQALALGHRGGYLLGAYADFLLDQNRSVEVIELLKEALRADGLLLRVALAEHIQNSKSRIQNSSHESHVAALRDRFAASRQRGDTVHRREEARFVLHLLNQPKEALRLATENWTVQREPADARILLECASAAHDATAAKPVLDWMSTNQLEDVRLTKLTKASVAKK